MNVRLFVGSYAPASEAGIHVVDFDTERNAFTYVNGLTGVERPSFLARHPKLQILYAVSETENGEVVAIRYEEPSLEMAEMNRRPTHGAWPCHLQVAQDGKWLYLVNYGGGSAAVYPLHEDGSIGEQAVLSRHEGRSVRDDRQASPHPHSIWSIPGHEDKLWLVPDLGTDHLYLYRHVSDNDPFQREHGVPAPAGSGPRHITFHPQLPCVYVIEELSSSISVYEMDESGTRFTRVQTSVSTLPEGADVVSTCADIHISADGRFLYGSNRGHDSIAVFHVTGEGRVEPLTHFSTEGRTPRNFTLLGMEPYLIAANQDSNNIVAFRLTSGGAEAQSVAAFELHTPVCLLVQPRQ